MNTIAKGRKRNFSGQIGSLPIVLLLLTGSLAHAGHELKNYSLSLRFPAAVSRFASYADVAGLGTAQAASQWASSINPASAAWQSYGEKTIIGLSPQYTGVHFSEGANLSVVSEALEVGSDAWGYFLPTASQILGNHSLESNGLGFEFDANEYQFQWGRHFGKDWAVGFNFNVTISDSRVDTAGIQLSRVLSESYDFRLGALRQIAPKLRLGLVADYGFAPTRMDTLSVDPMTFLPRNVRTTDTGQTVLTRVGIQWEYLPGGNLYLDYQFGAFLDGTGTLVVHRFPVGIEQAIYKKILFARVGATFDARGEVSTTGGLGIALGTNASIDMAYQLNPFPEIRQEFGQAQSFVVSVAVGF